MKAPWLLFRFQTRCSGALALGLFTGLAAAEAPTSFKFDFGPGAAAPGYTAVTADTVYSAERGYGFEPGGAVQGVDRGGPDALRGDFVTSNALFKFSVAVPEGNYRVTVTLGDAQGATVTTVKAETRRLMLERVRTAPGEFTTRSFLVNVRTPQMPPGNPLKLNSREWNSQTGMAVTATWDNKLTLQFSDEQPCVCGVEIEQVADVITVFLLGDSTVTDQATEPYDSWGQMLPRWFRPPVVVANHAESGETLQAFRSQHRWDKVMLALKPGDYVFLQFGHNDLNKKGHDGIWPREDTLGDWVNTYAEANTDYQWLLASYAVEVKRRGGIPVIVSPMTKINIRTGELNLAGLGDYPKAAVEAAQLADCACIDLNAMSIELARALGPQRAPQAYVDGLHSNAYGAYLFARCIVEGIRRAKLDLAQYLAGDAGAFDPAHPQPLPDDFKLPLEPRPPRPPGFPGRNSAPVGGSTSAPAVPAPRGN
jgi:lysophospholipase L1-like esterase